MILYSIIVKLYHSSIKIAAVLGHKKAQQFIALKQLQPDFQTAKKCIWIHAASAGEGNEAIPIAKAIRAQSDYKIYISFFSPSGVKFHKNNPLFDGIFLLPKDSKSNASRLLKQLQPSAAIFMKNELWWHFLSSLNQQRIPTFLVNASDYLLSKHSLIRNFQLECLKLFTNIYPTNTNKNLVQNQLKVSNIKGNTKFEAAFSFQSKTVENLSDFTKNQPTIIIGSAWKKEVDFLAKFIENNRNLPYKFIIAPHELNEDFLSQIKRLMPNACLFSEFNPHATTLIIDKIGILKNCYQYADIAIIGGGFGNGIHNILEAINEEIPVLFGPNHQKFDEASQAIENGIGFCFSDYEEFSNQLKNLIDHPEQIKIIQTKIKAYKAHQKALSETIVGDMLTSINKL